MGPNHLHKRQPVPGDQVGGDDVAGHAAPVCVTGRGTAPTTLTVTASQKVGMVERWAILPDVCDY